MLLSKTLTFYKQKKVQKLLVKYAEDKEVAVMFDAKYFGKRPDVLMYPQDVMSLVKKKATSLHCSEELWQNPMSLRSDIKKKEMNELRKGWDLILDIDCPHFLYSKLAAHYLVLIIRDLGVESVTCKFSGNKGFHLGVAWEAFPKKIGDKQTRLMFPEAPRRIAMYLRDKLEPILEREIIRREGGSIDNISKRTGLSPKELITTTEDELRKSKKKLDVGKFLEIDTILIAPRHLYRMPYSFHEKSELVSIPINPDKVMEFRKDMAKPDNVTFEHEFLKRDVKRDEAKTLILNSFDYKPRKEEEQKVSQKEFEVPQDAVEEKYFPPTIKRMLGGLEDGRKRALFTLINFLRGVGYDMNTIEVKINEWNERNEEPLRQNYIRGQLSAAKKQKEVIPPHNYPTGGSSYYKDLGVWDPDSLEKKVKNPLQYAKIKAKKNSKSKRGRKKLTKKQKEMRRKYREKKRKQSKKQN